MKDLKGGGQNSQIVNRMMPENELNNVIGFNNSIKDYFIMEVSYKESLFSEKSSTKPLDEIVSDIRTGRYKDVVEKIRGIETKGDKKSLKSQLPAFLVGVVLNDNQPSLSSSKNYNSSGIVQFDIDEYDIDESKKVLEKINQISSVLYSFLSPSGGVKFGVLTDFDCHDDPNVSLNRCDPVIVRYEEELFQYAENLTRFVEWLDARWLVWNSRLEKLQEMKNASKALEIWQEEQITLEAKDKERGFDMNEFSNLLNTLPENSAAQTASLLARMQAVEEEFAYKTDSQMKEYVRNMPQRIDPYAVAVNFELSDERVVAKHIAVNFDPDVANVNIASSHEYE